MAVQSAKIIIEGQSYDLTYNQSNQKWEASITAPGKTSFNQPGKYYSATVSAKSSAGTTSSATGETIPGLRLVVKERVAPVVTIISPSNGAFVSNTKQPVVFNAIDEERGSGVAPDTVVVKLDNKPVAPGEITNSAISGGFSFTYTPAGVLSEGRHTVTVSVSDNDGNAATEKSTTFTVDTVPPVLNVTSPTDDLITSELTVVVAGNTNDATSSPVSVKISVNDSDVGPVDVGENGGFVKQVSLVEGTNTIVITSTDSAGKSTSVTKTVTVDSSVPEIVSATITPNPVDAGQTMLVSVEIR